MNAARTRIGISALEKRLASSRSTITRWINAGSLPAPHYMGQRRFWFVDEIEEFEAKARGSTRAVESRPLLPKQFSREELISSLALIPQVENRLADHGILLVQQLEQWQAHELASLNGIGFKTIVDIQQALAMRQPPLMLNFKKP